MAYVYPGTPYDRPHTFLATLGSFWASTYKAQDQMETYAELNVQLEAQNHLLLLETAACVARSKIPLFHTENWHLLQLKTSDLDAGNSRLVRFDGATRLDGSAQFDRPQATDQYAFPLPPNLVSAPLIMNRITNPSRIWTQNVDYVVDTARQLLIFRDNPLTDPLVAIRPLVEDGIIIDQEAGLWLFRGQFDWQYAYDHFGYVLGIKMASSQGYKELLNALFDGLVGGLTGSRLRRALAAMTGTPLVVEPTETVELVEVGCDKVLVATDKNAYQFNGRCVPLVAAGDVVHAGDPLTDVLTIHEFNRGDLPEDLLALALGRGFLASCFYGELVFENREVPLVVDEDHRSGYTYCRFALGGQPLEVTQFFDDMHARGVAAIPPATCDNEGARRGTLAHLLDTRAKLISETKAANLPATINPLRFLITNVLRNNAFVVRIKASGMGRGRVGLYNTRHLRKLLPPHAAMLLLIDLHAGEDRVGPSSISECTSWFTAMNPLTDAVPASRVTERRPRVRLISGTCQ
jgi:hypothetical protein